MSASFDEILKAFRKSGMKVDLGSKTEEEALKDALEALEKKGLVKREK